LNANISEYENNISDLEKYKEKCMKFTNWKLIESALKIVTMIMNQDLNEQFYEILTKYEDDGQTELLFTICEILKLGDSIDNSVRFFRNIFENEIGVSEITLMHDVMNKRTTMHFGTGLDAWYEIPLIDVNMLPKALAEELTIRPPQEGHFLINEDTPMDCVNIKYYPPNCYDRMTFFEYIESEQFELIRALNNSLADILKDDGDGLSFLPNNDKPVMGSNDPNFIDIDGCLVPKSFLNK
jgi:hypothetical protein